MIELADVESPLTLFAEGIAGRYYHIKATSEFSSRRFTLSPEVAALSRDTIFVPETLDYPDSAAYRVLVLQQLGQQEFGTFDFKVSVAKEVIPELARLAAPAATLRESDFEFFYRHVEHPRVLQRLFSSCERARIAACVAARYPGVKRHVQAYQKHQRSTLQTPTLETLPQLLDAFDFYADDLLPTDTIPSALFEFGKSELHSVAQKTATVYDAASAALHIYDHWMQQLSMPLMMLDTDADTEGEETGSWLQREARLEDWEEELKELNTTLAVEMLEGSDVTAGNTENLQAGELRPPDVDIKALQNERDNLARRLDMERSAIRDALGVVRPLARSYRYDEWDYTQRRYLRRWCRLYEEKLPAAAQVSHHEYQRVIEANAPAVMRQLEQIKPLGYRRVSRVVDGDELDFNALIEARQDARAGQSPDDRVYSRKERIQRDVCAVFLIDLSASTDDPTEPPEPAPAVEPLQDGAVNLRDPYDDDVHNLVHDVSEPERRRIIDVQRESMLVMSAVLEQLGDSYGIYGFSGYGRDCVEFFVVKEPDQPFTQATLDAIAGMSPKRSTRMGPAIRHATNKLLASGNALKLLIILSDGFPQDCDYGPTRGDHEYGLQDTAKALQEAQIKGVETFCVTVDKSGHDYLKRMCPESRYLVIEEIEDLPQALSKVYQALAGR